MHQLYGNKGAPQILSATKNGLWAEKEGSMHVVKVPASVANKLKPVVCDSFVGTGSRFDTTAAAIEE